jgi:serine/threonine protein phosphatase PrpC
MTLEQQQFPHLDIAARSRLGAGLLSRAENQDNFLLIDGRGSARFLLGQQQRSANVSGWTAGHVRAAVLDGMGGHGHGREAAEAVVAGLLAIPPATDLDTLSAQLDDLHTQLQAGFAAGADPERRPGTTLTMLDIPPTGPALLYHCGDSRLYKIAAGKIEPLTVDHVPATTFAMEGLLSEREWWQQVHGEHRPQISQAFILGNAFDDPLSLADPLYALTPEELPPFLRHLPDRRALELDPDAVYLLATDGFWSCADPLGMVAEWPALFDTTASAQHMLDGLFGLMERYPPGFLHPDNLTAIVIRPHPRDG